MSKELPVYELGQWIKNGERYGRIVARSLDLSFDAMSEVASNRDVLDMANRGDGYCVQWVVLDYFGSAHGPTSFTPTRRRWIGAKTIAGSQYQPCPCPVKAPVVEATIAVPEQFSLGLTTKDATIAALRAAIDAGDKARDVLRAMGVEA